MDLAGWRWAFVAVVPVAGYAFLVARRAVRESRADPGGTAPLDWIGAGLSCAGLLALVWGLIAWPERGASPPVLAALLGGLVLLAAFVLVERRLGDGAMTPLTLFARLTFAGLSLLTLFLYAALGGLLVLLPYVLIEALGYSVTAAGAAILPFPLVLGLLSRAAGGAMTERFGTRALLVAGSGLVALGFLSFAQLPAEGISYWRHLLPGLLVLALGMAASVAPLTTAVLGSAGERYAGVG